MTTKPNGRGNHPQASDPFTALRNGILSVANAKSKQETMARMQGCYRLLDQIAGFTGKAVNQYQVAIALLLRHTYMEIGRASCRERV